MPRVIINVCHGGFGLSNAAVKRCIAEGSQAVTVMTLEKYTGGRDPFMNEIDPLVDIGDGYQGQRFLEGVLHKDGNVYFVEPEHARTDAVVLRVVEEMGEAAHGHLSKLKIVEIPDGVSWEIDEYDGWEHVAEVHRTWQ